MELIHADFGRNELGFVRDLNRFDAETSVRVDATEASNSWRLDLGADLWQRQPILEGHYLYIPDTEWGGPVEKVGHNTRTGVISLSGCTWRGMLGRQVICPPEGQAYRVYADVSADRVARELIEPILGELFRVPVQIAPDMSASFRFDPLLRGFQRALNDHGLAIDLRYNAATRMVEVHIRQVMDFSGSLDLSQDYGMDMVTSSGSLTGYNHLIALGRGELTERQVLHLYRLDDGSITEDKPAWADTIRDRVKVYDYSAAETVDELRKGAVARLNEYAQAGSLELDASELDIQAQLGDIVGARDRVTGMACTAPITGMILKMSEAGMTIEKRVG